ncbi:SSI family serine proteinase inhibitor [Streptomyces sp. NPDC059009]|uniref:SSI family serine proteinase inhibitor n=1 Tax=Streptomyces sp. NPDC059009 TaxID=3346694 RepID=UPI0036C3A32F
MTLRTPRAGLRTPPSTLRSRTALRGSRRTARRTALRASRTTLRPAVAVALLALTAVTATTAAVSPAAASVPTPPRGVFLTVSGDENTWIRGVLLRCAPEPSGHHPRAAAACAALDEVHGDFDALRGEPRMCTKEFDPVTVSATGTHRGRMTGWHKTYPNACVLLAETGPVFDF